MLRARHLRMMYQPIIDLATGKSLKVEALARLLDKESQVINPGEFLPEFGNRDLLQLFQLGLLQACAHLKTWQAQSLFISVALNLPPNSIGDERYHNVLFATLGCCKTDPSLIDLEVLETDDIANTVLQEGFFRKLQALGVGIDQDDLGSGHSSLLRMKSMPCDAVKLDQGLVRGLVHQNPQRTLKFIYHLTNLTHALGVPITVEGLEHDGLIEATAILGADRGQGYGIAHPMRATSLPAWWERFIVTADVNQPRTALGIMARALLRLQPNATQIKRDPFLMVYDGGIEACSSGGCLLRGDLSRLGAGAVQLRLCDCTDRRLECRADRRHEGWRFDAISASLPDACADRRSGLRPAAYHPFLGRSLLGQLA
jgi:EAL domain-containing protein (putative c-di-GMP-specific phosphodiesterase class I)